MQIHEPTVEWIIYSRNERRRVGTQEQRQGRNFFRLAHSPYRLGLRQLVIHLLLAPRIILAQVTIHELSMYARWRDAVAANPVCDIVARNRVSHRDHGAFTGRICKAVGQSRGARDRRHVQDYATANGLHVPDDSANAVVIALHVDAEHAIKVVLGRCFDVSNVRNSGVVHEYVDALTPRNLGKASRDIRLITYIATMERCFTSGAGNFGSNRSRIFFTDIEDVDRGAVRSELYRDRPANAAAGTGYDRSLAIEPQLTSSTRTSCQSETPRFQGIKSSWPFCSAFVRSSPLAT